MDKITNTLNKNLIPLILLLVSSTSSRPLQHDNLQIKPIFCIFPQLTPFHELLLGKGLQKQVSGCVKITKF